jgi:hypothetical protein
MKKAKKPKKSKVRSGKIKSSTIKSAHKRVKSNTPEHRGNTPEKSNPEKSGKLLGNLPFSPIFLICEECGREIVVDNVHSADQMILCCGQPMQCKD